MGLLAEGSQKLTCPMCNVIAVKLVKLYADRKCASQQVCCRTCKRKIKNKEEIIRFRRDAEVYNSVERELNALANRRIEVKIK